MNQSEPCQCGRGPRRPRQRTCKACHAEDMRDRRAAATARGTYTLRGCRKERSTTKGPEMKIRSIAFVIIALAAVSAQAQTIPTCPGTPAGITSRHALTISSVDDPSLLNAATTRHEVEIDTTVHVTPVESPCLGPGTMFSCHLTLPPAALTAGSHTIRHRVVDATIPAAALVGPWSDQCSVTVRSAPAKTTITGFKTPGE